MNITLTDMPQNIFDFQICMIQFLILHLHMLQLNTFLKLSPPFLYFHFVSHLEVVLFNINHAVEFGFTGVNTDAVSVFETPNSPNIDGAFCPLSETCAIK